MPDINFDNSPPVNTPAAGVPMDFRYMRDYEAPRVYWLPTQYLDQATGDYYFDGEMPGDLPLHVPKVVRFIYTYDNQTGNPLDYCGADDADDDGDPPPPDECEWVELGGTAGILVQLAVPNLDDYGISPAVSALVIGFEIGGNLGDTTYTTVVTVTHNGVEIYTGPVVSAPIYSVTTAEARNWQVYCNGDPYPVYFTQIPPSTELPPEL